MRTEDYLFNTFGIDMCTAREFLLNNYLTNLQTIYDICLANGVNNKMIADVLDVAMPGITETIISEFFDSFGFDGSALDSNSNLNDFTFTHDWLSGKTLYNVHDKEDDQIFDDITQMRYEDSTVYGVGFDGQSTNQLYSYSVDNQGIITMEETDGFLSYIAAIEYIDSLNAVEINWTEDYNFALTATEEQASILGTIEYFFLDSNSANSFIG